MGTPNESDRLVNMSIESESPEGGETLRIHLRKMRLHADDMNCLENGADASNASNRAETACISSGDEVDTYLGAGDAKHMVNVTDGVGSQTNVSSGHKDVSSIQTDANKPANTPDIVSTPQKRQKSPDIPIGSTKRPQDEPNGCRERMDGSNVCMDWQTI